MKISDSNLIKINPETRLRPNVIFYMQSASNYTHIYTADRCFLSSKTLKVLNKRLTEGVFIKIRRGLLVNSLYIATINSDRYYPFVELINGQRFLISRRNFIEVLEETRDLNCW